MAVPSVSGADGGGRNTAGAFTAPLPAGVSWIAVSSCRRSSGGGSLITPPAGWTLLQSNAGDVDNAVALYHSGVEPSPGTSWTAPSNTRSASVLVIGFDQTTEVDVSSTFSTNLTSPSVTVTEAVRVCRVMTNNAWNNAAPTANYPAGTSDGAQIFTQNASADASEGGSLAAFAGSAKEDTGSTGTAVWSFSAGSSFAPRSCTVALIGTGAPPAPAERDVTSWTGPAASTVDRAAAGTREVTSWTGPAASTADRAGSGPREVTSWTGPAASSAEVTSQGNIRTVVSWAGPAVSSAARAGAAAREVVSWTGPAVSSAQVIPGGGEVPLFPWPPQPISGFPWPPGPVSGFPWPPRPVRSFEEVGTP